jgi:outer membrane protein TolC
VGRSASEHRGHLARRVRPPMPAAILALSAGSVRGESLQDAWDAALRANQGLQAAQTGTASAQRSIAAARAERVPTVATTNAYTWLNTLLRSRAISPSREPPGR